jgi:hypothetical protein
MIIMNVINLIIILFGVASMYTSWIQISRSERLSGKELSIKYPEHGWMRWGFIIIYISWVLLMFILFFYILDHYENVYIFGGLFASIGLFDGVFALVTGVCLLPTRIPWLQFVVGDDARRAGRFQVVWSLIVFLISVVAAYSLD